MGIFGALLGIGGSIGKALLQGNAASQASAQANAAAQQANAGLQGVQNQTQGNLQPFVGYGQQEGGALAGLLGVGGDPAASAAAFNNFRNSTNYNFLLNQGLQGVQYANAPNFNSGATAKALNNYAQGMAGNALQGYEGLLQTGAGQGIGAAGTLGALGNQNLEYQGQNLLNAAGVNIAGDYNTANAWGNALNGITSGLSSFGSGGGGGGGLGSALQGLFGGGQSSFGQGLAGGTTGAGDSALSFLAG